MKLLTCLNFWLILIFIFCWHNWKLVLLVDRSIPFLVEFCSSPIYIIFWYVDGQHKVYHTPFGHGSGIFGESCSCRLNWATLFFIALKISFWVKKSCSFRISVDWLGLNFIYLFIFLQLWNWKNPVAFGSSGNGSCPVHGLHRAWGNSSSYQHHSSSPMIWPNSPSFSNGVHAQRPTQVPGFPRPPPHMLNIVSPVHHHHVGSAPAVNPSLWDRRHVYSGESPETSGFHLGSLGSVGFPGSSPLHPLEMASHIFPHVGGNCMDISANVGLRSPQQICHVFPGRNPMLSIPSSFDLPMERVRNLSHRRTEANSNHTDKKQYELDIDRILRGEDCRTTLMIKNIPNKYVNNCPCCFYLFCLLLQCDFVTPPSLKLHYLIMESAFWVSKHKHQPDRMI